MPPPPILVVTGPTASGKSALALSLAAAVGGEIVSADSMQVYCGLDIGTAKPTAEERRRIPHHLIDVADPAEVYHVARFLEDARRAIGDIGGRGRVPIVTGGTALYLKALLGGLAPAPPRDEAVRRELDARWDAGRTEELWRELVGADPDLAARLHPNDRTRVVRGLEVFRVAGVPLSALQAGHGFAESPYKALRLGLEVDRRELYRRIDSRVLRMMAQGWVREVEGLLTHGLSPSAPPLQAIGYRQLCRAILAKEDPGDSVPEIQRETRRFAKRQMTWFRRMGLEWVHPEAEESLIEIAKKFLQRERVPL